MLEEYPKEITLPDGINLTLRPMTRDDQYALYNFFVSLAGEDRRFLRNDVTDRKLIEKWARNLNYDRVLPILAEYKGAIVANATLDCSPGRQEQDKEIVSQNRDQTGRRHPGF